VEVVAVDITAEAVVAEVDRMAAVAGVRAAEEGAVVAGGVGADNFLRK
jgi:hypothetical protein